MLVLLLLFYTLVGYVLSMVYLYFDTKWSPYTRDIALSDTGIVTLFMIPAWPLAFPLWMWLAHSTYRERTPRRTLTRRIVEGQLDRRLGKHLDKRRDG